MNLPLLVVVQNRETQFDAPLYALIHRLDCFPLKVIYTAPAHAGFVQDSELGFAPGWDHLVSCRYPNKALRKTSPLALWRLACDIKRQRPGLVVICGYFPRSHLLLAVCLRLLGQRIGLRSDNTLAHTTFQGLRGKFRRLCIGPIQRFFQTWHPVGQQAHSYLRTLSGAERPSYRFAYAVDNDWFEVESSKARSERTCFLQEQAWPEDAFVVLGIMKWNSREDPLTLVKAFEQLRQQESRARLILVGDGPLRDVVDTACNQMGAVVLCPGYVSYKQLPQWYGRADVFVHPAPDEPWGVSVTEALACGVPVIAAEGVGAAHEVLLSEACGAIFPNGDATGLATILETYANRPCERDQSEFVCRDAVDRWHYRHTIEAFQHALKDS